MAEMSIKGMTISHTDDRQSKFCQAWPSARIGLDLLAELVKNPVIKTIIKTVVKAGDQVAAGLGCPVE